MRNAGNQKESLGPGEEIRPGFCFDMRIAVLGHDRLRWAPACSKAKRPSRNPQDQNGFVLLFGPVSHCVH